MSLSRGKKIVLISTAIMAESILVAGYALIDQNMTTIINDNSKE